MRPPFSAISSLRILFRPWFFDDALGSEGGVSALPMLPPDEGASDAPPTPTPTGAGAPGVPPAASVTPASAASGPDTTGPNRADPEEVDRDFADSDGVEKGDPE